LLWVSWRWGLAFCPGWPGWWSSYFKLPAVAGWKAHTATPAFFHWDGVLQTFLHGLSSNHNPPDLSLSCSLGWQVWATLLSCWLIWNFSLGLASNLNPPNFNLPSN
jgi:hypothetical protein